MVSLLVSLLMLMNVERNTVGINPLVPCYDLVQFANQRANEQVAWDSLDHYKNGIAIVWRLSVHHSFIGENLAGWNGKATAEAITKALMASPTHRQNMLEPGFNCVDIGINEGGNIIAEIFANT